MPAPRFLFLPVSGPGGAGEFYRSVAVARSLERRWPGCRIRFVVSRDATYAEGCPYPVTLVDRSPTHETERVREILHEERPDVVIFDSSGRVAQFREARRLGAKVVYVSSRESARRKGFRLRRMRWIDQHWIAQPRFLGGDLHPRERLKCRMHPGTEIVFLEVLFEPPDEDAARQLQAELGLEPGRYAIACPGGAGSFPGRPDPAPLYFDASGRFVAGTGIPVLALLGKRFEPPSHPAGVHVRDVLPNGTLMALLREAKLAMLNGGSLLVQAIAQGTAAVAAPIADDQPARIDHCAAQGLVRRARLDATDLAQAAIDLAQDEPALEAQRRRARGLGLRSGLDVAVEAVARLLPTTQEREAQGDARDEGPLRVMQVILSRGFAGSERAVAESCNAMCAEHAVTLVIREDHRSAGGASIRDHLDPRVRVVELPAYWRTRERLAEVIRSARPDVIHTHLRRGTRYVAQIRSGVPHVCTLHLSLNGPHYLEADGLICISRWQQDTLPAQRRPQVFLIPNSHVPQSAVTSERRRELRRQLGAGDGDYLIGTVGRLTPSKGIDVLLRAFAAADLPHAKLAIIGEGRQLRRLRRLADERVCFAGFRQDAKECFQAFDLFVSPSRNEPFGRVIIEAMDAGTPVIATSVLGPSDIARDYPIELVPPDDVAALSRALQHAASGARGRTSIDLSEFHVDTIGRRVIDAYRRVIRERLRA